jgi:4-hydroxythreonine-4-phosphate dehydrogenase
LGFTNCLIVVDLKINLLCKDKIMNEKATIGISCGDLNGIGLEVFLKTLSDITILNQANYILYCPTKYVQKTANYLGLSIPQLNEIQTIDEVRHDTINCLYSGPNEGEIIFGNEDLALAQVSISSLEQCTNAAIEGEIHAMVTAPIHKKVMNDAGFNYAGHTDYFEEKCQKKPLMILMNKGLRVALLTAHIPISKVASSISELALIEKIKILSRSMNLDFGISEPNIAILGLNPHAGDGGIIGMEEIEIIIPTMKKLVSEGYNLNGPFAADGFFGSGEFKKYDGILAMYHDQGLAPFKALSFGMGVNYSAGLDIVRTSPDHGTGFNISGKNIASEKSFKEAILSAITIVRNRHNSNGNQN